MLSKIIFVLILCLPTFAGESRRVLLLTPSNTVTFRGEVNYESVTAAQLKLAEQVAIRGNKSYTIYLVIDSPGGDIDAGEDLIQFAKRIKNLETVGLFAASMGSAIIEALPGKRYATESSVYMFHRAKGQFRGQFENGEVEARLALSKLIVRNMEVRNAKRLGISIEEYKSKVINELWALGDGLVKQGMADEIIDLDCSPALTNSREHLMTQNLFGVDDMTFSGCPLIRSPIVEGKSK